MASPQTPAITKALVLRRSKVPKKPLYHDVTFEEQRLVAPQADEVVVKMHAVAFNHREVMDLSQ